VSTVRTVLGDVPSNTLGVTYAHEHLVLDSPLIAAAFPHILLDDIDIATAELGACAAGGVGAVVDAMPCAAGRDAGRLAELSRRTGVHVIAATGLHHGRYYGPRHWSAHLDPDRLAQLFVDDISLGVDAHDYTGPYPQRTPHRAGIIKVASGGDELGARGRRLFEAAAIAHRATGAPILTHCEHGHGGLPQVEELVRHGVPPSAVLLSHVDKVSTAAYHRDLAASGAWLVYDQALRQASHPDPVTAQLVEEMIAGGYGGQVLLATDGARRDLWTAYGGSPGLAWLATGFRALLTARGLDPAAIDGLYVTNPHQALTMRPVTA
jgi:predicted metal-dependent phosphotriesterase family hydrolase